MESIETSDKKANAKGAWPHLPVVTFEKNSAIPKRVPFNVNIEWEYQVKLEITKSWQADGKPAHTTFVERQSVVEGIHTIPE